jgi:hypothetical protein
MEKEYRFMDVELVLGNPKIECDGYGICKFVTRLNSQKYLYLNYERVVKAKLYITEGILNIIFDKSSIDAKVYLKYFGEGYFIIEVDTDLPDDITAYFGISPSIFLKGNYQIRGEGYYLKIEVSIGKNNINTETQILAA